MEPFIRWKDVLEKRWNSNSKISVPNFNVEITLQGKHEAIAFSPAVTFLCTAPNKDLFNVRKSFGKIEIQLSYLKSSLPKLIVALPNAEKVARTFTTPGNV